MHQDRYTKKTDRSHEIAYFEIYTQEGYEEFFVYAYVAFIVKERKVLYGLAQSQEVTPM